MVTPKYTYIAERNGKDWNIDLSSKEDSDLLEEYKAQSENMLTKDLQMGYINYTEKTEYKTHYIWKFFFNAKQVFYERKNN